ncbi:MAG: RNHCP domain-containing protein [Lachnospiraceae bacterium]|nr:RNHCP domain-containing protein [Lachnospiraceae bacterium]
MSRENKKKKFDKGYFQKHPCLDPFTCRVCGRSVVPEGAGTDHRNHCPYCLSSLHVDETPGDRRSKCHGVMDPIAVWVRKNNEWALIHRCRICGKLSSNRIAADDHPMKLMALALRPFAGEGFSREGLARMSRHMDVRDEGRP